MYLNHCPVCNSQTFSPVLEVTDYLVSRETFSICQCAECRLRFTNPRPDTETLGSYYRSEDYISHTSKGNTLINRIYKLARYFTVSSKERLIAKHAKAKTLLDIGCGTGHFLQLARKKGWEIDGVEVDENARSVANRITEQSIYASLKEVSANHYSAITLWHVLEHLPDLTTSVSQIISKLAPDGILFIAIPNYLSYEAQKFENYWAAYDVPRHLYHFTPQSMTILAENNGLAITQTIPMCLDAFYISLLSNQHKFGRSKYVHSFITGLLSNIYGYKSKNYSSIIYLLRKK